MSNLQTAIGLLFATFYEYAGKEGDKETLTKAEVKDLLHNELGDPLGKAPDQAVVDEFFSGLDMNQDKSVDFPEFLNFVGGLAMILHLNLCQS